MIGKINSTNIYLHPT